jgi:hypothetical protein
VDTDRLARGGGGAATSLTTPWPARLSQIRLGVLALAFAAPAALLLARLLPAHGVGLAMRIGAATVCVLVLPGALLLRSFAWPREPGLAVAGSFVLSLTVAFGALALTFALDGSLALTIALGGVVCLAAAVPAARAYAPLSPFASRVAFGAVIAAALVFGGLVWWAVDVVGTGDVLFHLARARKLAEADGLSSVAVANEYADGGLHPGYAFPLWHGVVAMIATLAGVDVAIAILFLNPMLVPIAFAVAYAAGTALFRSWAGGVAVLAAQVALLGFSRGGIGAFTSLSLPASITRVALFPAFLAFTFAYLRDGGRWTIVPLASASLALAVIHPTYLIFAVIPVAGFALIRLAILPRRRETAVRFAWAFGAMLLPAAAFFAWLYPVITSTASHSPTAGEETRALVHYGAQLQIVGDGYRAAPDVITRAGPVMVAAIAVLPLVAVWARRAWAAFAVGGMLLVLAILLVPELFTRLSDLVSISQSRRLAQFLPVPFAVAAAAAIAGRLRLAGVAAALGAGILLELAYTAETSHAVEEGGPVWPMWVAFVGAPIGLVVGLVVGRRRPLKAEATAWAAAAALAFIGPITVGGLASLERSDAPDRHGLTPGLVDELNELPRTSVVFAPVPTSYRVAAYAPVYVAATPPPHAADTDENRPYSRQRDTIRFFAPRSGLSDAERRELLERYGADVLLVAKQQPHPRAFVRTFAPLYEDRRYALFQVDTE